MKTNNERPELKNIPKVIYLFPSDENQEGETDFRNLDHEFTLWSDSPNAGDNPIKYILHSTPSADSYCPKCEALLCSQQVTFEETHQACGTPVTAPPADEGSEEKMIRKISSIIGEKVHRHSQSASGLDGETNAATIIVKMFFSELSALRRENEELKQRIEEVDKIIDHYHLCPVYYNPPKACNCGVSEYWEKYKQ